jgi:hypothetical protein
MGKRKHILKLAVTELNFLFVILVFSGTIDIFSQKNTFVPDTTVNNMFVLMKARSIIEILGDQSNNFIDDSGPSRVIFKNAVSTQYLVFYQLNGSNSNSFNNFEIGILSSDNSKYKKMEVSKFSTESGIELGIGKDELLSIKGLPDNSIREGECDILTYIINDPKNKLLKYKNMPEYKAEYCFKHNKLVRFVFGFPYN